MENSFSVPRAGRLFGRQRPIHAVLGGGKVADVLLWRDRRVSGAILIGITAIWYLFEVLEYNLVTLLCHFTMATMLLIFILSSAAEFFNWNPPKLEVSSWGHVVLAFLLSDFLYVACGYDPKRFLLTIVSLWMISIIGSSISTLNLLFFGIVCLETIPFLYEQYEDEVDNLAYHLSRRMKKMYSKFEAEILGKIPGGPAKDKNN